MGNKKKKNNKDVTAMKHKAAEVVNVADISEEWLLIYGSNVNIARMSPQLMIKSRYALIDAGFYPETQYLTFCVDVAGL